MSDISDEDCVVIEKIYLEYCQFEESKGRTPIDRTEWAKTMLEVGDKLGDPYFIKNLIERYKMKKNTDLTKFHHNMEHKMENNSEFAAVVAERIQELEEGIYQTIELKIPIETKLYWSKKGHYCKLKWWSEEFMKDAIEYHIQSVVEKVTEDFRNQINQEIESIINLCKTKGISENEIFSSKEYVNKLFELC